MKILHICNGFTTSKLYEELFNRLSSDWIEQTVIAPSFTSYHRSSSLAHDIKLEVINRDSSPISRMMFSNKIKRLTSYIENNYSPYYDIIHAHTLFSDGFVAYNLYKKFNVPYVIAVRNSDINFFFKYLIHKRSKAYDVLRNASLIVCISPKYIERLRECLPKDVYAQISNKIDVIPNGISNLWLDNKKSSKKKLHTPIRLIFCGTIDHNKNIHSTLKAAKILNQHDTFNELLIIGKRNEQADRYIRLIEKQITDNGIVGALKERMSPTELIKEYEGTDIFVMPSFTETFGLVYVEALTQGLPVIYTQNEGFDGFFEDGYVGKAVNAKDSNDIAKGIQYVVDNYDRLQQNIQTLDFSIFNWDIISKEYIRQYNRILNS